MAPCWVEITHDGQFPVHREHSFRHDLPLLDRLRRRADPAGQHASRQDGGVGAVDARLSPDGRFLYVDQSRIGAVGAFTVNGGSLTELPSSPTSLPADATPAGIVVS
jgi:hypothetical protein